MPRYQFVQREESVAIVSFDADNLDHAEQLMSEVMDADELPNSEVFWKNGNTDWEDPEESDKDNA